MSARPGVPVVRVERAGRLLGFVAIDSTMRGRARGGLRLVPDLEEVEVRAGAQAMTLKYGLLRLPQGGAKAGVHGDPDASIEERRAHLLEFGRAIEPLLRARSYVPDADIGTRAEDMRWLFEALSLPVARREWRSGDSGSWTACSVVAAARAALATRGRTLVGSSVAVEGFGAVGAAVAERASALGARVVAVSTSLGALHDPRGLDVPRLIAAARATGSEIVRRFGGAECLPRAQLLELPVDVLLPCARHHSIHVRNAAAIRAPIVCPGANAPIAEGVGEMLDERGILHVPDFVANCGGVLGGTMAFASIDAARTQALIGQEIEAITRWLIVRAESEGTPLRALSERVARERFAEVRRAAEHPTPLGRVFALGLAGYRSGLVPSWISARLGESWFARRVRIAG